MGKILIVGSGVSGCTAGLELAEQGHSVSIIESGNRIGGKVLSYCCKATDECSRCGVCIAHTIIADALAHPGIEIITSASVLDVQNSDRRVAVTITCTDPRIMHRRCTRCDACLAACPAKSIAKYDRGGLIFYAVDHETCIRSKGGECAKCAEACGASAISLVDEASETETMADAVLIATGHRAYNATEKPALGLGRLKGVITAEEAERILSTQTYLGTPSSDVAFVQCVGSRDPAIGRNYCSAVCCAYATRMARALKHRNPDGKVTVYFIDLQNFDKTFAHMRNSVVGEGVNLVRAVPFEIDRSTHEKLRLKIETADGTEGVAEHDIVVLSVGLGPDENAGSVASLFGLDQNEFGFFRSDNPNVFVAGTCEEPRSITDAIASARSAAARIVGLLPRPALRKSPNADAARTGAATVALNQRVMVIGAGIAGSSIARKLTDYGYETILVEHSDAIGGRITTDVYESIDFANLLSGVDVLKGTRVLGLAGNIGSFALTIGTGAKSDVIECGAIVACSGSRELSDDENICDDDRIRSIADMQGALEKCTAKEKPRRVAVLLDVRMEETKASTEMALRFLLDMRVRYRIESCLFCREVRVSSLELEKLYERARIAGVDIVKYDGELGIQTYEDGVRVAARDVLLGDDVEIAFDMVGVSPFGMNDSADAKLAKILGIDVDQAGHMQNNNVHVFPALTNRPGVFVVGACRGRQFLRDITTDADATALAVHSLLSQQTLDVDPSTITIDATKCAMCLTCVRICPHAAMTTDVEKRVAVAVPEACQGCGTCVAECPARAIELCRPAMAGGPD